MLGLVVTITVAVATEVRRVVEWPRVGTLAVGTDVEGPWVTQIFCKNNL